MFVVCTNPTSGVPADLCSSVRRTNSTTNQKGRGLGDSSVLSCCKTSHANKSSLMESVGGVHNHEAAPHVLVIAVDPPGHIVPLLNLAIELGRRGITITFVRTSEQISRVISADGHESSAELRSLDMRFVCLRVENSPIQAPGKVKRSDQMKRIQDAFEPVLDKLMDDKLAGIAYDHNIRSVFDLD